VSVEDPSPVSVEDLSPVSGEDPSPALPLARQTPTPIGHADLLQHTLARQTSIRIYHILLYILVYCTVSTRIYCILSPWSISVSTIDSDGGSHQRKELELMTRRASFY
jgi:hypothetical protein